MKLNKKTYIHASYLTIGILNLIQCFIIFLTLLPNNSISLAFKIWIIVYLAVVHILLMISMRHYLPTNEETQ